MKLRRRRLGQHYLARKGLVVNWFRQRLCGKKTVVEIGAGHGELTRHIAPCVETCIAIEIDFHNIRDLNALASLANTPNLQPVHADALHPPIDIKRVDAVYGNLPYSISTEMLINLVKYYQGPAYIMLQREVAARLASKPGSGEYGRLSIIIQLVYDVELGPIIPPHFFKPPPKVYSQLVELRPRRRCSKEYISCIEELTACLFNFRRKLAYKAIAHCTKIELNEAKKLYGDKRVYQLALEEVEEVAVNYAGCRKECSGL